MIKIENTKVTGFDAAMRGMRNPMNSWDKSDSKACCYSYAICSTCEYRKMPELCCANEHDLDENYILGPNDLDLAKRLAAAGPVHAKYRRMMIVYADVTAPLYWWKEYDTYKVGTVANSCSTMHKIHTKEFTLEDFSCEHLRDIEKDGKVYIRYEDSLRRIIEELNQMRAIFNQTKDKEYWYAMIQMLPESYNQKRTLMLNYEVLADIYHSRKDHRLDEWREFCEWIENLPYSELITGERKETK